MEESKYLALRERLRAQADNDERNREFIRRFVLALEAYVNREAGREQEVCVVGNVLPGVGFRAGDMSGYGSTLDFALEVRFHTVSGVQIFQHAVPFKATYRDAVLTVECKESGEKLEIAAAECVKDEGKRAVAIMLDGPVTDAVDNVLRKLAAA